MGESGTATDITVFGQRKLATGLCLEFLLGPSAYLEGLKFRFWAQGNHQGLGKSGAAPNVTVWGDGIGDGLGTGLFPAVSRVFVSRALYLGTGAARSRSGSSGSESSGSLQGFRSVDSSVWGSALRSL